MQTPSCAYRRHYGRWLAVDDIPLEHKRGLRREPPLHDQLSCRRHRLSLEASDLRPYS